ncbi:6,7-dimethyl-8-ribityllumazine synthase [Rickettsiales bacterium]|nr:6,7-dimethyl-8-ribityllumazine synthase [Rickettsiales bacterium]
MTKIAIIVAGFYEDIAKQMKESVENILKKADCEYEFLEVPGCFEIPSALHMAISSKKYDGYITLGCVIRGETTHYDYVCEQSARGINDLAIKYHAAVGYGIITSENKQQAEKRASASGKDVGGRAAIACLEMLKIKQKMGI